MDSIVNSGLLGPVVALNAWTFVIEGWALGTRMAGMKKYNVSLEPDKIKAQIQAKIPPNIQWKVDNYNHLLEQPTQFYAIALALAVAHGTGGTDGSFDAKIAWGYVGVRIVHSLIQVSSNVVPRRFFTFLTSSALLAVLTVRCASLVF